MRCAVRRAAPAATGAGRCLRCSPPAGRRSSRRSREIPQPLITRIPVVVGVHLPLEFREPGASRGARRRRSTRSRSARRRPTGFMRVMNAMFTRVVPVAGDRRRAPATDPEIRGVLEPVLEDFAFVTPARHGHAAVRGEPALSRQRLLAQGRAGRLAGRSPATARSRPAPFPGKATKRLQQAAAHRDARRGREARGRVPRAGDRARPDRCDGAPAPAPAPAPAGAEVQPPP